MHYILPYWVPAVFDCAIANSVEEATGAAATAAAADDDDVELALSLLFCTTWGILL